MQQRAARHTTHYTLKQTNTLTHALHIATTLPTTQQTNPQQTSKLSWEAATQRLLDVSAIAPEEWPSPADARYDRMLWRMYRSVTGE